MKQIVTSVLLGAMTLASQAVECHTKTSKTIVEVAVGAGSFTTLAAAVDAAGLVDTLNGQGPFTVFAPTYAAFAKLPEGTVVVTKAGKVQCDTTRAWMLREGLNQAYRAVSR